MVIVMIEYLIRIEEMNTINKYYIINVLIIYLLVIIKVDNKKITTSFKSND